MNCLLIYLTAVGASLELLLRVWWLLGRQFGCSLIARLVVAGSSVRLFTDCLLGGCWVVSSVAH